MNESNNNHQNRNTTKEFSSSQYLLVSLLFLVIAIILLFVIVEKQYSPEEKRMWFFITILIAGMAFAAFIFGTMRSYASWTGIKLGGNLKLAGPIVGAALVIVGGYYYMANSQLPNGGIYLAQPTPTYCDHQMSNSTSSDGPLSDFSVDR